MGPSEVAAVPYSHRADLYRLLQEGVIGWNAAAYQSQLLFDMIWNFHQTVVQAFGGKGNKRKSPPKFAELFPVHAGSLEWIRRQRERRSEAEVRDNLQGAFGALLSLADTNEGSSPTIKVKSCQI